MRLRVAIIAPFVMTLVWLASLPGAASATTPKFLTLPFQSTANMHIQRGWWTVGPTGLFNLLHHGIDYIDGVKDVPSTWKVFPVYAAAAGDACGALISQNGCVDFPGENMGNRVLIRHVVDGTVYYTWYNHLKSIARDIPLNSRSNTVHVARGQLIGYAGDSGSPGLIHLHFELDDAHLKPIDPYGIYGPSFHYPDPAGTLNHKKSPAANYWISNPPTVAGAALSPPTPSPARTPAPRRPSPAPPFGSTSPIGSPSAAPSGEPPSPGSSGNAAATPEPGFVNPTTEPNTPPPDALPPPNGGAAPPSSGATNGSLLPGVLAAVALLAVLAAAILSRRWRGRPR